MAEKIKRIFALALASAVLLTGCGSGDGDSSASSKEEVYNDAQVVQEMKAADSVFSINYDAEAGINPISAKSSTNMQFWSLMYDSVFTVESDLTTTSEIVTEVRSDDYEWWVFYIDTSIVMHDGSTLTAKDIVYSITRARQFEYYANRLECIYGISAMGDDCFAITTYYPNSQLTSLLNIPIVKEGTLNQESAPVGSGPYKMDSSGTKLVKHSSHRHAAEYSLDTIYLKNYMDTAEKISAFEASLIDVVTNDPTGMYNLGYGSSNETRYYDTTNMHYIGFNFNSMYFSNYIARYAVASAVDRDSIVKEFMGNCGVSTLLPVHPKSPMYDKSYEASCGFDLGRSQTLFQNCGVKDYDNDGELEIMITGIVVEFDIDFIVNTDSTVKLEAARKIADTLNSMGITTNLRELGWDAYIEALEEGDYDMYYGEVCLTPDWNLSYLFEPYTIARDPEDTDKGMNYANCFDERYIDLYADYLAAGEDGRAEAYAQVLKYITDQSAIVPICFERREILTHRGVISGINATQYDIFNNFNEWTIDLK